MKKFYTLAAISVLALTASAEGRVKAVSSIDKPFKAVAEVSALPTAPAISTQSVASINDFNGEWEWAYYGLLSNDSGEASAIVQFTVTDATTGAITISNMISSGTGLTTPVKATVDLANGTVTLPNNQNLGQDSYGDTNYFYIKHLTEDYEIEDGPYSGASIVGNIVGDKIVFPDEFIFAIGDPNDEDLGWWKLTAFNEFVQYSDNNEGIDLAEWTEFTTATMIDGWILPVITYNDDSYVDPADFPLTVKVSRNNDNENLLLIENPYMVESGFPLTGGTTGYIVIDVTDPEFVLVNPGVFSGFTNGANKVCCLNIEGFYTAQGFDSETIKQALYDVEEWSTVSESGDDTVIDIPNCRFNYTSDLSKLYTWNGRADAMKARITLKGKLSGVEGIAIDNKDAKVEYFNLQGVRVDNPAAGQLVIKRQGSEVTKMIVR